jgi:hypothetical protein
MSSTDFYQSLVARRHENLDQNVEQQLEREQLKHDRQSEMFNPDCFSFAANCRIKL